MTQSYISPHFAI